MDCTNINASPSRRPFWGCPPFPGAPASRRLPMQSLMTELWPEGCSKAGKEGGSALFHRDPRPGRYRPPESIPCWDIIPFNQGWLPDWPNKGQGGVRAAASRGRADSDTFTRLGEPKTKRPLSSLSPIYTPPPTTNITRLAPCPGWSLMLVPADQGFCAVCWGLPLSIRLSSCDVPTLIPVQRPLD